MTGRTQPFVASFTQATIFNQGPIEVINTYLAAVDRPAATEEPKRGLFRRPKDSVPEFRLDLEPGPFGWEFDGGYRGVTAWIFTLPDGSTLLLVSHWQSNADAWRRLEEAEIWIPCNLVKHSLGGTSVRGESWTFERFADELAEILGAATLVTPALMQDLRGADEGH
jgi:hypothetical protein